MYITMITRVTQASSTRHHLTSSQPVPVISQRLRHHENPHENIATTTVGLSIDSQPLDSIEGRYSQTVRQVQPGAAYQGPMYTKNLSPHRHIASVPVRCTIRPCHPLDTAGLQACAQIYGTLGRHGPAMGNSHQSRNSADSWMGTGYQWRDAHRQQCHPVSWRDAGAS